VNNSLAIWKTFLFEWAYSSEAPLRTSV